MKSSKQLPLLFLCMLKLGAFTFGGGYAMIALLENEFVSKRHWVDADEFWSMIAISESTPGPIAVNAATYIGYRLAGILGSLVATVGVVLPSFVLLYLISLFFDAFLTLAVVANAFRGIRACVIYLILSAGWKLLRALDKRPTEYLLFGLTLAGTLFASLFAVSLSSVLCILAGGFVGLCCFWCTKGRRRAK